MTDFKKIEEILKKEAKRLLEAGEVTVVLAYGKGFDENHPMPYAAFMIVYGFYLSYLGYFSLPGVGPRFTLHDFALLETELPGIFLTNTLRAIINAGESIPAVRDHAIDVVQRDVFPSGHTQLTIIVMALGFRYKLKSRWVLLAFGCMLIVATVYLRYHYVVDLVAGALLAWFTFWTGDKLEAWWRTTTEVLRGKEMLT